MPQQRGWMVQYRPTDGSPPGEPAPLEELTGVSIGDVYRELYAAYRHAQITENTDADHAPPEGPVLGHRCR